MCSIVRRVALEDVHEAGTVAPLLGRHVRVDALTLMGHVLIQLPLPWDPVDLRSLLDLPLPDGPNRASAGNPSLLWLGPRAWVAITDHADTAGALAADAATALRSAGGHAVDLSDAHQSLRVSGRDSGALLSQGCALDLESAAFPAGSATRTSFGRMSAILHREQADSYVLHVDRSLANQLWDWLRLGVQEMAALALVPVSSAR